MERVEHGMLVDIEYDFTLKLSDGSSSRHPSQRVIFVFGVERQLPALEDAVRGREKGEVVRTHLEPENLTGERDEGLVMEIPRAGLKKQRLSVGRVYREIRKGCMYTFTPLEIREDTVLADFNPPGRGSSADVVITINDVRKAGPTDLHEAHDRMGCGPTSC